MLRSKRGLSGDSVGSGDEKIGVSARERTRLKPMAVMIQGRVYSRKRGPPGHQVTADKKAFVKELKGLGLTHVQIALLMKNANGESISIDVLESKYADELKAGPVEMRARVHRAAFLQATGADARYDKSGRLLQPAIPPNPAMTRWVEATRYGMKEGTSLEVTGKDGAPLQTGAPQVVIILPSNGRDTALEALHGLNGSGPVIEGQAVEVNLNGG